jgi:TonB-linked SusC/RagA family outer membrane protein
MITEPLPAPSSGKAEEQADLRISGKVKISAGEAVPGANIILKGTSIGTVTDIDGTFSLSVPDGNGTLIISFIGFTSKEIPINNQTEFNIVLQESKQSLDEVVVIGYGAQKSKDLTGSVSSIDQAKIRDLPVASIDQKMVGQIAGVRIQTTSGIPGGGSSIKIRGTGSMGAGNQPLFVIDGMPYSAESNFNTNPLALISPSDIESISVLKDASSTAIYGSRGANGVILINTKKGSFDKTSITVSAMRGVQSVPQKGRPVLMNQREFADVQRERITKIVRDREKREATLEDFPKEYRDYDTMIGDGTDWYDLILQSARIQDYNVGLSRGSSNTKYSLNLGYFEQEGVVKYTGFERYSAKLSVDSKLGSGITVGASVLPTYITQKKTTSNTGRDDIIGNSFWQNPVMKPYDESGNLIPFINSPANPYKSAWSGVNPLFALREIKNRTYNFQTLGNLYAEWEIVKDLKFKTSINGILNNVEDETYIPKTIGSPNNPPNAATVGSSSLARTRSFNWLNENLLTYNTSIGSHQFDALLGYTAQSFKSNRVSLNAGPYTSDVITTINAAQAISSWGQDIQKWTMLSYLGRVNYSYKSKYLATATLRRDGSSRFGSKSRFANFPSLAVAWRVSEEDFLKNVKFINDLKIRSSVGKSGNNNIGNFSHVSGISSVSYLIDNQQVSALSVGIGNPLLTWEESRQIDLGVDLVAFNDKVTFTADYYHRKSMDMLISNRIPAVTGFTSQTINIGSIQNKGLEFNLSVTPFDKAFQWTSSFNIAFNRNKVLSLNGNNDPVYSGSNDGNPTHVTMVGKPIAQFFGYEFNGLVSAENLKDPSFPFSTSHILGGPTFKDLNKDGIINPVTDFAVLGNPHEKFFYGFTNNLSYKNLDLSIVATGQFGGKVINGLRQTLDNTNAHFNIHKEWVNRWRSPEDPGDGYHGAVGGEIGTNSHTMSNLWVENASFLRLSNVSLGYTIPAEVTKQMNMKGSARFYVTGQNLLILTKYKGANPEAQAANQSIDLTPGFDIASYPLSRTVSAGVNLSF